MSAFDPENPVFDSSLPIKTYAPYVAREFSDLAAFLHDDLKKHKHKSGAIESNHPDSPSGYARRVLTCAPSWFSELYWQYNRIERMQTRPGSKLRNGSNGRTQPSIREMILGPIRRPRVIPALARIRDQTDLGTSLHSILREHIFSELTDPEKYNSFPVREYFGMNNLPDYDSIPF